MQVDRNEDYAPVKNAPGAASDSPDTACAMVSACHRKWVEVRLVAELRYCCWDVLRHPTPVLLPHALSSPFVSGVPQAAGGSFATSNGVFEVAPSVSYDGEGLHELVSLECPEGGFSLPCELRGR